MRLALVPALLALLWVLPAPPPAWGQSPPPRGPSDREQVRADLAAIVSRLDVELARGGAVACTGSRTTVNVLPGQILVYTLACEDLPTYGTAFFVYSVVRGEVVGELMQQPGEGGVRRLEGPALDAYLARVGLDLAPLFEVVRRHAPPRASRGDAGDH